MILYFLWRLANALGRIAPRPVAQFVARRIAELVYLVWTEKRENAIDNARHVLPDADEATVRWVAREMMRNYARYLADFIHDPTLEPERVRDLAEFDRWEFIDEVLAEGKGLIFVLMHFGNWDSGGAFFTAHGYTLNVIAETFQHDKLNDMVVGSRRTRGMKIIPMEKSAFAIVRALRRNEALAILIDRPTPGQGVRVDFFGAPVEVPAGPARIARMTGARVVPVAFIPQRGPRPWRTIVDTRIATPHTNDEERDVHELTQAIMHSLEQVVRAYPDQWYMFRRMWQGAPAAVPVPPGRLAEEPRA